MNNLRFTVLQVLAGCIVTATLLACGGGASSSPPPPPAPPPTPPTVSITGNATTVVAGGSITLTWSSTNATSCTATGGWNGSKATSGSETVSGVVTSSGFAISCTGSGGTATGSVSVSVTAAPPLPTVSINATAQTVALADSDTLIWSSVNATACSASDGWAGAQPLSGTVSVGPITKQSTFTLTCDGPGGSVSTSVTVAVSSTVPAAGPVATLAAGVTVLDPITVGQLVQSSSTTLTFNGTVPLTVGEVFLMSGSAFKVTATRVVNGQTLVDVTAPTLDQIFSSLDIAGTYTLDASQAIAQSVAAKTRVRAGSTLSSTVKPNASTTISFPLNLTAGPVAITGSGTLTLQVVPDIHYSTTAGFSNSSIVFTSNAQANATISVSDKYTASLWVPVTTFRIPIPLTVVDGLLNLVGVSAAAIYVPVYIGADAKLSFGVSYVASAEISDALTVNFASDGSLAATTGPGGGSNSFSVDQAMAAPSSSIPALLTLGDDLFSGIEVKPSLLLLNTVTLMGVDLTLGEHFDGSLTVLGAGSTSPFCGSLTGNVELHANAFLKGISGTTYTWPSPSPFVADLFDLGMEPIGTYCEPQPVVTASVSAEAVLFSPVSVSVVVVPPPTGVAPGTPLPAGQVEVNLDGDNCFVTLDANDRGSCDVTPSVAGPRTLTFEYLGDTNYQSSLLVSQPLDVALSQDLVTLGASPSRVAPGGQSNFVITLSPSPNDGTQPLPAGSVSVMDETGTALCTTDLGPAATAACSYAYASSGTHTLTAVYGGDTNYVAKSSGPVTLIVSSLALQLSPSPLALPLAGTATLTVTASDDTGPVATPTGLLWGSSNPGVASVADGVVTGLTLGTAIVTVSDPVSLATASVSVTVGSVEPGTFKATFTVDETLGPISGCVWYRTDTLNLTIAISPTAVVTATILDYGPPIPAGCFSFGDFSSSGSGPLTLTGNSLSGFVIVWVPSNGGYYGYQLTATAAGKQITGTAVLQSTDAYSGMGSFVAVKP